MRKNYNMKKTISTKRFISELGQNFSEHIKARLLELELRCVLTRKEESNILDLKHVEHTKYPCSSPECEKEYVYAQFIVEEDELYFSNQCLENDKVMQSPIVNTVYNTLTTENKIFDNGSSGKKIDDSNIDYVVDSLLSVCPDVSKRYMEVLQQMSSY
ncbi:hypothetical protein [Clostridium sp. KNHs214]|uniref:hypothetical protein n=1 Tax=Clostridium sp. KNHs214 TaxID=1540257 RepID=UPI0005572A4F|nr:hypothetical protein [Clostridium sp. KNHs214]